MKKVVFCEIAWMKYYSGVTEDDKPMHGGKYIDENGAGGEVLNFFPINHKLYGYVMHYGNELHIERYDKILKSFDEVDDVTVVWVATDGTSSKIVGWYEHATMYRYWQGIYDSSLLGPECHDYNFIANEEDCYLIPEEDRTFVIPRASKAGTGRGMGQSQIWYADSKYAQEEFIPQVLEYLESIKEKTVQFFWTKEDIEKCADDTGITTKELIDKSVQLDEEGGRFGEVLSIINLAVKNDDCFETRRARAEILASAGMYDEAEEDFKQAIYFKEDLFVISDMIYTELMLKNNFLAINLCEKIRKRKDEYEGWPVVANNLAHVYINEGVFDKAIELVNECKNEENASAHKWIEVVEERIKEEKELVSK